MPNLIYEGPVSSWDKKADGSPLIIGKGDRQGEPYYKLSFKVNGEYVNLMDFDGVTGGKKGDWRVEYYQKFLANGEPDLYNGKPQYALVDIQPLGANTAASAPQTTATQQTVVYSDDHKDTAIRRAVAIKAATEEVVALVPFIAPKFTDIASFDMTGRILTEAARIDAWLATGVDPGWDSDGDISDDDETVPF